MKMPVTTPEKIAEMAAGTLFYWRYAQSNILAIRGIITKPNATPEECIVALTDGVPGRGVAGAGPRVFRRQSEPVMFRAQPRA